MPHLCLNRNARIVRDLLPQPCQSIEETRLSRVRIAGQRDAKGFPQWPAVWDVNVAGVKCLSGGSHAHVLVARRYGYGSCFVTPQRQMVIPDADLNGIT